jgi:hypothetical protein
MTTLASEILDLCSEVYIGPESSAAKRDKRNYRPDPTRSAMARARWKKYKNKYLSGIKKFHKSSAGRSMHRGLGALNSRVAGRASESLIHRNHPSPSDIMEWIVTKVQDITRAGKAKILEDGIELKGQKYTFSDIESKDNMMLDIYGVFAYLLDLEIPGSLRVYYDPEVEIFESGAPKHDFIVGFGVTGTSGATEFNRPFEKWTYFVDLPADLVLGNGIEEMLFDFRGN